MSKMMNKQNLILWNFVQKCLMTFALKLEHTSNNKIDSLWFLSCDMFPPCDMTPQYSHSRSHLATPWAYVVLASVTFLPCVIRYSFLSEILCVIRFKICLALQYCVIRYALLFFITHIMHHFCKKVK